MSPSLRHLGLPHQASLKCPLRRLCSSTAAAINMDPKNLSSSFGSDSNGVGGDRFPRPQTIAGLSESLIVGNLNHRHRSCHELSPRASSVLTADGGTSGLRNHQQVAPSTRSSTPQKHSRPLFFSTALATTASDPPASTEAAGTFSSASPGARPSQRAPGAPLNASSYEHEHGGDKLNGLQQQGRRVFSSVPAAVYHYDDHESFSEEDEELLQELAREKATALSLRDIHAFCQSTSNEARILQARFLHREIPIRFAQRALELRNLPHGLSETAPVVEAAGWYTRIVQQLVEFPVPDGAGGDERFGDFLSSILMDHTCVPQALSRGVLELRERGEVGQVQRHRIDRILDNFFISRISLRFLVDTYVSSKSNKPGFSGVIQSECSPVLVAWRAAEDVDRLCRNQMGIAPPIEVFGREQDTLTAIPSHLYYIIREVLKNSCRATVEHCRRTKPGQKLTPVKIIVARGKEDMTIKIMDEGGGIRRSDLQHVWSYMYSTARNPMASQLSGVPLDDMSSMRLKEEAALRSASAPGTNFAFAGYGMGLPLSRLYARYFGGSLKLRPMEGYGTDAYVHMHRIKTNSEELLPNSLEETLRVMDDDGRVNVTSTRSWKPPPKDDGSARALIRSLG